MNTWQAMVNEFHEKTNSTVGDSPELRDPELRAKLIMEEAVETIAAMGFAVVATIYNRDDRDPEGEERLNEVHGDVLDMGSAFWRELASFTKTHSAPDFEEAIDGLCDLIYVVLGSAVAWGIDLDPFFREVQRANMEKLKGPKRDDGKQLKPEGWQPPDIEKILIRQIESAREWNEKMQAFLMSNGPSSP